MSIDDFFRLYPISRRGIADMLGTSPRFLYNMSYRHNTLSAEQMCLLNEAIQELSHQLSKTFVINNLSYRAKCRFCNKKFTAKHTREREEYYSLNGLVCDECMALEKSS